MTSMPPSTCSSETEQPLDGIYVHQTRGASLSLSPSSSSGLVTRSVSPQSNVSSPSYSTPSPRPRTFSTPMTAVRSPSDSSSNYSEGCLRRRSRNTSDDYPPTRSRNASPTFSPNYTTVQSSRAAARRPCSSQPWGVGLLAQCIAVFVILGLVWNSHRKVELATEQLVRYQEEESSLVLKLENVESRARELRETIRAIKDDEAKAVTQANSVEPALKTLRLQQELAHLEHEDNTIAEQLMLLQKRIQKSARKSIVKMFGEGTVHVDLHLQFPQADTGTVTFEMSDETPHAVWVWLQQIIRHDWDDSMFRWKLEHVILATPARLSSQSYKLEFIEENTALNHQVYSVGLSHREDNGVNFYVNLLDNGPYHSDDVCIGRVVGGFDTLKTLLAVPIHEDTKHLDPAVTIRSAKVRTLPKQEEHAV